jgi:hypothetical protein
MMCHVCALPSKGWGKLPLGWVLESERNIMHCIETSPHFALSGYQQYFFVDF